MTRAWPARPVALAALLLAAAPARAAILYVGTPADRACHFSDVQAAIDHAATLPGADVIRLVHTREYPAQSLVVSDSADLSLVGGYDDCSDPTATGAHAVLEGSAGQWAPIVTVEGTGTVKLRFLTLSDNTGAGLHVACPGCTVELLDSTVRRNGRGVYATTAGCSGACPLQSRVRLGANVRIRANVGIGCAGLLVENATFDMTRAPGSEVSDNQAKFDGGGLCLWEGAVGLVAGPFLYNQAGRYGGAIVVAGSSRLLMYPTGPGLSPVLRENRAGLRGGALYVEALSARDETSVIGWDALLEANAAAHGGAVYVVGTEGSATLCLRSSRGVPEPDGVCPTRAPLEAVSCPGPLPCASIARNVADEMGSAVMSQGPRARVHLAHQFVVRNAGPNPIGHIDVTDAPSTSEMRIDDSVVHGGGVAAVLNVRAGRTTIRRSTILTGSTPFFLNDCGAFELVDSIVWAPGEATLVRMGTSGTDTVRMVLASEVDSLGASADVQATSDPGLEGYDVPTLRPDSPAIDYSDSTVNVRDLAGHPRGIDLPGVFNRFGPRDLGALERQHEVIPTEP